MRLPLFLLAFATVFVTAALAEDNCRCQRGTAVRSEICQCWSPNARQITAVEGELASRPLPLGSLDRYVRYYAAIDGRLIRGKLLPARGEDVPGFHIVEGRMLPPLPADGCVIKSDPDRWVRLDCAPPGAWSPSDVEIAELEETLRLQLEGASQRRHVQPSTTYHPPEIFSRSYPSPRQEPDLVLQNYARHYAGVTVNYCREPWPPTTTPCTRRAIVGALERADGFYAVAGIYIGIEAEFPRIFDGGCILITVRYDPSSKQIWWSCNGV
jgi:hypothetical protein